MPAVTIKARARCFRYEMVLVCDAVHIFRLSAESVFSVQFLHFINVNNWRVGRLRLRSDAQCWFLAVRMRVIKGEVRFLCETTPVQCIAYPTF